MRPSARLAAAVARRTGLRTIAGDARGTALIEFAMVLPVVIVLYLGGYQVEDAIACNRKVTIATRAAADLVAQNVSGTTTTTEIDGDLAAAAQVLAPYAASSAIIRVTEVGTDNNFKTTVQWSRAVNATAYTKGATAVVPPGMQIPGTYFLFAEVTYAYTPAANFGFVNSMKLYDSIYMIPRNSTSITCTGC